MKNNDEKNGLLFDDGKKNRWKIDYVKGMVIWENIRT